MLKLGLAMIVGAAVCLVTVSCASRSGLASPSKGGNLPDGSTVTLQVVSYGTIHHVPWPYGPPSFYKSAAATIMFTTCRKAPPGRTLEGMWTGAEALGPSGAWYPLRRRLKARPAIEGLEDGGLSYEGPPPTQMWETWEFANSPPADHALRVRVFPLDLTSNTVHATTNTEALVFDLPNSTGWRVRSAKEELTGFNPQKWLDGELVSAAICGETHYVRDLVDQGANLNASEARGLAALGYACQNGHDEVARYLLDHGASPNAHGPGLDRTPLMAAASNGGHIEILRLLVERGADVNARGELGWSALVWAAREGDVGGVKYLLGKGANAAIRSLDGETIIELTERTDSPNRQAVVEVLKKALESSRPAQEHPSVSPADKTK
jgi:hypothetical protein